MNPRRRDCLRLCAEEGLARLRLERRGERMAVVHAEGVIFVP